MLTRYFTALTLLLCIGVLLKTLLTQRQKCAIHQTATLIAKWLLIIALLTSLISLWKRY